MKKVCSMVVASLLLAGLFSFSSAATKAIHVTGVVRNALTQNSIPEAAVLVAGIDPLTFNPSNLSSLKYDTLTAFIDGSFDYDMTVDANATILAYGFQKPGFIMTYGFTTITGNYIDLGVILLQPASSVVTDNITISGTVVDSATGQPVAGAVVSAVGLGKLDTTGNSTVTGADGKFSKLVSLKNQSTQKVMLWAVTKTGYKASGGQVALGAGTTIDLGTIKIASNSIIITTTTDTLTVSGTVVDANTSAAIAGATVVLTGLGPDNAAANTTTTDADGKFSKQVIITNLSAFPAVVYTVSKTGYSKLIGQSVIPVPNPTKAVDVGTIQMVPGTAIKNAIATSTTSANNMKVYSLRGQLLYAGPVMATERILKLQNAAMIVTYCVNNRTLNTVKLVPGK
jgi:hypothetical protein